MSLNATNFVNQGPIKSVDIKQFVDLFTGVMTDQPVTFKNATMIGGSQGSSTPPLKLFGVSGQTGNLIELYPTTGSANATFGFGALGNFAWGPGSPAANDTFLSRIALQNGHVTDTAGLLVSPYLEAAGTIQSTGFVFANGTTITSPSPFVARVNNTLSIDNGLTVTNGPVNLPSASVPNAALGRDTARANLLTNGGFEIWQRGTSTTGNGVYLADRWLCSLGGSAAHTCSRIASTIGYPGYSLQVAATITGGYSQIAQQLTDQAAQLIGKSVSASIHIKSPAVGAANFRIMSGATIVASQLNTLSGVDETIRISGTVPAGTTVMSLEVIIATTGTYEINDAMLVVGSVAADYAPLHPADDLARCLRYYEALTAPVANYVYGLALAFSTANAAGPFTYKARKAVTPTVTFAGTFQFSQANGAQVGATLQSATIGVDGCQITNVSALSGLATGNASLMTASASSTIGIEANP